MNLCPGDVLAMRYKVKRRIGGGSFGEIYIGRCTCYHVINSMIPNSFIQLWIKKLVRMLQLKL